MFTEWKLSIILSLLKEHPNPNYLLEQYSITPSIAASVLFLARDDIKNKKVYDLGCGTGRFAIGSALLGANVVGIDIDRKALKIAEENAKYVERVTGIPVTISCKWIRKDIRELKAKVHTVIQFPPFGNDLFFFENALEIAKKVYSLHKATEEKKKKIEEICKKFRANILKVKTFKYKVPWEEKGKIGYEIFLIVAKH